MKTAAVLYRRQRARLGVQCGAVRRLPSHSIGYEIAETVHRQLCNRKDKTPISAMPF